MIKENGWKEIEHDADLGLHVKAQSVPMLFQNAANGMINLMLDVAGIEARSQETVEVEATDGEGLLIEWLEEILFLFEVEKFAPFQAEVLRFKNYALTGSVRGERYAPKKHEVKNSIKAVTWHNLLIKKSDGFYETRIIFDV